MEEQLQQWNRFYKENKETLHDNWLEEYSSIFQENLNGTIIDLGCGNGGNSNFLYNRKCNVIACDYSMEAIRNVNILNREIDTKLLDFRRKLPFTNNNAWIVLADLSLHYFTEKITKKIIQEIHRIIMDNGCLLARVNSTKDFNFGAGEGIEIEKNYYDSNGKYKRFFDKSMIDDFFLNSFWKIIKIKEYSVIRYEKKEKILWEIILKKQKYVAG